MNTSKKTLLFFLLIGSFVKAQSVFIGSNSSEKMTIKGNSYLYYDGLTLTPSSNFHLSNTKLSKLGTTSNTIGGSISKSYYFDNSTSSFTGSLKISYQEGGLNGETENTLGLILFNGSNWENQTTTSSNTNSNFIIASINDKTLKEITLSNSVIRPPTDISLTSNTISENSSISSLIGTLSATDSDTSISSLTFSFTSSGDAQDDDNGSFTISGTSLLTSTTLDYETKTSYNIYVKVSDGTSDFEKAFTVSVTNVLEPITDLGFESIVKDGLLLHLDSRNTSSYPGTGSIWYDLSGNGFNGNLINSPSFSDENGGIINLDGSTQWVELNSFVGALTNTSSYTILLYFRSIETSPSGNIYNNAIFSMHKDYANRYRIGAAPDSSKGLYHNFGCSGCPDTRAGSGINLHNNEWRTAVISKDTNSNLFKSLHLPSGKSPNSIGPYCIRLRLNSFRFILYIIRRTSRFLP